MNNAAKLILFGATSSLGGKNREDRRRLHRRITQGGLEKK
jgi:hypothetical protein